MSVVTSEGRVGCRKFRDLSAVLCAQKWWNRMKGKLYKTYVRLAMT